MQSDSHEMKMEFIEIWCALDEKHTQIAQNIVDNITNQINVIELLLNSVEYPNNDPKN